MTYGFDTTLMDLFKSEKAGYIRKLSPSSKLTDFKNDIFF